MWDSNTCIMFIIAVSDQTEHWKTCIHPLTSV